MEEREERMESQRETEEHGKKEMEDENPKISDAEMAGHVKEEP